jgi:hypothetical protein
VAGLCGWRIKPQVATPWQRTLLYGGGFDTDRSTSGQQGSVFQVGVLRPLFHLALRTGAARLDLSGFVGMMPHPMENGL